MSRDEIVIALFAATIAVMFFLCGWFSRAVWVLSGCGQ